MLLTTAWQFGQLVVSLSSLMTHLITEARTGRVTKRGHSADSGEVGDATIFFMYFIYKILFADGALRKLATLLEIVGVTFAPISCSKPAAWDKAMRLK